MVDYESYLTRNWMALLSVIRYWEGPGVSESAVKIRLKGLSLSDDKILLSPLVSLADLDDAAQSLGYDVLIVPTEVGKVRALLSAGMPVLVPEYGYFNLVFGFDDSRSIARAYSFGEVSERLRGEARREAKEILEMEEEGQGQSRDRLGRIRNEAYVELGPARWQPATLAVRSPLMAVVCPKKKEADVAGAMGASLQDLRQQSNGLLAALVGLAHLNHADPVKALEWAMTGSQRTAHPLPLHVGHLALRLWESRHKSVRSRIPLQDALPQLRQLATFFERPEHAAFLQRARQRFEDDRAASTLPWYIADKDLSMLDPSEGQDLTLTISALRTRVRFEPSWHAYWTSLANNCERAGDLPCVVEALEGAVSASTMDSATRLRLAYAHVLQDEVAKTAQLLETIDREKVRYEADYRFCLGAVAEWRQDEAAAVREYEQAIAMRAYRAIYHLRLGALLARQGKKDGARQALEWAAKVDAERRVAEEAGRLIDTLGGTR
jgi:tetratricopeptide (TPR) repeat protein